jgi:hypothetical protein
MGFIDGSEPCPPKFVIDETGQTTTMVSPDYSLWQRKDQCLLSWFNTTMSDRMLSSLYGLNTSKQVWSTLATRYASQSKARITYLKRQLQTLNQGSKSCSEYLGETKACAALLAAAGQPVEEEDLISYVLGGLSPAYTTFITLFTFSTRTSSMSFEDFQAELLNHEILLGHHQQLQQPPSAESGNFALYSHKPKPFSGNYSKGKPGNYHKPNPQPHSSSHHPRQNSNFSGGYQRNTYQQHNFRRHGSNQFNPGNQSFSKPSILGTPNHLVPMKAPCQICGKSGHQALDCFHRMNYAYQGKTSPSQLAAMMARTSNEAIDQHDEDTWYADSGANSHVTGALSNLTLQEPFKGDEEVAVGNGTGLPISHIGSSVLYNSKLPFKHSFQLQNILHCPSAAANLLSIHQFCVDNKCWFILTDSHFFVKDNLTGQILLQGPSRDGLYPISLSTSTPQVRKFAAFLGVTASSKTWHSRLGHPAPPIFNKIKQLAHLPVTGSTSHASLCEPCQVAKSKCLPFYDSNNVTAAPLEIIHSDLWSSPVSSLNGYRYYVVFIDNFSRFSWIYPLYSKSETFTCFVKFKCMAENLLSKKIKFFQSDGGGEFTSNQFKNFLTTHGIQHRISCPYTAQQNGLAERKHRHIVETGLALLAQSKLPITYWVDAFNTAVYLINRLPTAVLKYQSPYAKLLHKSPNYSLLRTFGCACYPLLRPYNNHKLMYRSKKCIFLGYCSNYRGYKCYDPISKKTIISRHVIFDEHTFPAQDWISSISKPPANGSVPIQVNSSIPALVSTIVPTHTPPPSATLIHNTPQSPSPTPEPTSLPISHIQHDDTPCSSPPIPSSLAADTLISSSTSHSSQPAAENADATPAAPLPTHPMTTRLRDGTRRSKPFPNYKLYSSTKHPLLALHTSATSADLPPTPTRFSQAAKSHHWIKAMTEEFAALQTNHTWTLCPRPSNKNIITNKWVFKVKQKADGTLDRFKARLVAKGFQQQDGIDYNDTFSPVVKSSTIRAILAIAVHFQWPTRQLDVSNAFLHGNLQEEVFMEQPPGFVDSQFPNHVCRLNKSIYGLKQAPRAWFTKLANTLLGLGFIESKVDYSLFLLHKSHLHLFILIYVDDIIVTGNSIAAINQLIECLNKSFAMKDLGPLHYFLGIHVQPWSGGLHLSQTKYVFDLLERMHMAGAKPAKTPLPAGSQLSQHDGDPLPNPAEYRHLVGALQYCTFSAELTLF